MFNVTDQEKAITQVASLGEIAISSEYMLVPDLYPELTFLIKGFALPVINATDVVEVPLAGGIATHTSALPATNFKSGLTLIETTRGHMTKLFEHFAEERDIITRLKFDFTIYQGTPDKHTLRWDCSHAVLFGFEPVEIDGENRTAPMNLTGQVAYHCFGSKKGNI